MKLTYQALALILVLVACPAVRAEWQVETRTDSMTDEVKTAVLTRNEAGHSLSFYRVDKAI